MAIQAISTTVDLAADTAADLTTLQDVRLSDGYRVWVIAAGATHGLWMLDKTSVAVVNGTTVVATFSGVGRWTILSAAGGGLSAAAPEPIRFDVQGVITSDFFLGNQTQQNANAKVSRPIAVAATYTKMRVKLAIAMGIGGSATFTVFNRLGATTITGTMVQGDVDVTFTVAGVAFAANDTMSVQVHSDVGPPTSPEVVVF